MQAGCRNERCYEANEVIVHVTRVAESGSASSHDRRHLVGGCIQKRKMSMKHWKRYHSERESGEGKTKNRESV